MKGKEKGMKVERNGDGKEERRQRNVSGEKGRKRQRGWDGKRKGKRKKREMGKGRGKGN